MKSYIKTWDNQRWIVLDNDGKEYQKIPYQSGYAPLFNEVNDYEIDWSAKMPAAASYVALSGITNEQMYQIHPEYRCDEFQLLVNLCQDFYDDWIDKAEESMLP